MENQCTKFEVSRFIRCKAMNGGPKCTNWGSLGALRCHSRSSAMSPQSAYDFLFDFNRNHASISCRFRDIAGYLSKVADFDPPPFCIWRPVGADPGRISRRSLASENQSPWAIVWCCLCDPTFSRFSRTPTYDRQTDTDPWLVGLPRMYSIAR